MDKKKYLIAFNTYSESAEHPTDSPPTQNIISSLCVAATETGNGECLSKALLCDSVSNGGGVWEKWVGGRRRRGGGALLFEACCQRGMPKIGNVDISQE